MSCCCDRIKGYEPGYETKELHNISVLSIAWDQLEGGGVFRIYVWKDLDQLRRTWRVEKQLQNIICEAGACVCEKLEEFGLFSVEKARDSSSQVLKKLFTR